VLCDSALAEHGPSGCVGEDEMFGPVFVVEPDDWQGAGHEAGSFDNFAHNNYN
jgi:hypothetical protein